MIAKPIFFNISCRVRLSEPLRAESALPMSAGSNRALGGREDGGRSFLGMRKPDTVKLAKGPLEYQVWCSLTFPHLSLCS